MTGVAISVSILGRLGSGVVGFKGEDDVVLALFFANDLMIPGIFFVRLEVAIVSLSFL